MPRHEFHIVSLERVPTPLDARTVICLDTNVVASIVSLYKRGYDGSINHTKVVNLFQRCSDGGVQTYDQSLDLLEGSGFHLGGVVPYNAGLRYTSLRAILRALATGTSLEARDGIPPEPLDAEVETNLRKELDQAISHLPWAFLPSYCLALSTHLAWKRNERHPIKVLNEVFAHAPFVPDESAILSIAALDENSSELSMVAQRVMKRGSPRPLEAAASAAWDLAHLIQLRHIRTNARAGRVHIGKHRTLLFDAHPVLVTDDNALGEFAGMLFDSKITDRVEVRKSALPTFSAHKSFRERVDRVQGDHCNVPNCAFDNKWREIDLDVDLSARRERQETEFGEYFQNMALDLEKKLSPESETRTFTWPPPRVALALDAEWLCLVFEDLYSDWSVLLELFDAHTRVRDILTPLLMVVPLLLGDNARARGRTEEESWHECLLRHGPDRRPLQAENLIELALQGESRSLSLFAAMQKISFSEGTFGPVLISFIDCMRWVVSDTADAREVQQEVILETIINQISQAHGSPQ